MDNLKLERYLDIVNEEKVKRGLDSYIPLYPMLRVIDGKLYISVILVNENDNVWDKNSNIKPEYWVLIDINTNTILEFNETDEKDFINGELILKETAKSEEVSKYMVNKTIQYRQYLLDDIKNDQLPIQKRLSDVLNNELDIDGEKVNANEYIMANIESDIKEKVNELVDLIIASKYNSITFYYDNLFNQIIDIYNKQEIIDKEKIKLCIDVMNNYYDGVVGIDNLFNI